MPLVKQGACELVEGRNMTGFMYILRCRDGSYYVGSTTSGNYRIQQHKDGLGGDYTRRRLPVELVSGEEFPTLHEAFLAERQVKGWSRQKKEALIRGDYDALPELSWNSTRRAQKLPRCQTSVAGNVTLFNDGAAHVLRQAQDDVTEASAENERSSTASSGDAV